ncbi:MAG: mechanosensitive ion channel family protein [Polyangiaceae bacterium]
MPFRIIIVMAILGGWSAVATAQAADPCANPRGAADSVFHYQQPGHRDLVLASQCFEDAGRDRDALQASARHIKAVYDARALYVVMDAISEDPNHTDPRTGAAIVTPHADLPELVLVKRGERWLWTRASLDRADELYDSSLGAISRLVDNHMPEGLRGRVLGVEIWQYLALLVAFIAGLVLRRLIQLLVGRRIRSIVEKTGESWGTYAVDVFASPGATLVMAGVIRVSYPELGLPIGAATVMSVAVRTLVVISVVWAAYRVVDVIAMRMAERAAATDTKLDDQLVPLLRKSLKVFVVVAGALFLLQNLNVNVGSLLAGLGIGGLAFALAAKDTIANVFGSVTIFVDRPFQIGDWVVVDGAEGIVEEVGFRSTRIRTFYDSVITIPNARFMEAKIDNYGARRYRRTFVTLNLTYDTSAEQMQAFVEGVRAIIAANPHTWKDKYEVHMSGFGASSLDVMLYFFFDVETWSDELRQRHNVYLEILGLAEALGVAFAFPTRTLHLETVAAPGAARSAADARAREELVAVIQSYAPGGERSRPGDRELSHGFLPGQMARGSAES